MQTRPEFKKKTFKVFTGYHFKSIYIYIYSFLYGHEW